MKTLILIVALTTAAMAATAQPPGTPGAGGPNGHAQDRWDSVPQDRREQGLQRAEQAGMFSRMEYSDGHAEGQFVMFDFDEATGTISNYTAKTDTGELTFLASVTPDTFDGEGGPRAIGSLFSATGADLSILAHSNPVALTNWHAQTAVTLTVELGENVSAPAGTAPQVRMDLQDRHAHLVTNATSQIVVTDTTAVVQLTPGEGLLFVLHPGADAPETTTLHAQNDAFAQGRLGAAVRVANAGGTAVGDHQPFDVQVNVTEIRAGAVKFQATADVEGGRVLFLTIDGETVDPSNADQVQVTLDGNAVTRVANAAEVLNAQGAAATVVGVGDQTQVVVRIDDFSTRTVEVQEGAEGTGDTTGTGPTGTDGTGTPTDTAGTPTVGFVAAALTIGAVAAARARRR